MPFACKFENLKFNQKNSLSNNVCFNLDIEQINFILPRVCISVNNGNKNYKLNHLVDTRSQRSYFDQFVLQKVKGKNYFASSTYDEVRTFLDSKHKKLKGATFLYKIFLAYSFSAYSD